MSLTLITRPLGHRLNTTDVSATIIDDGQGNALVYTSVAHGLSDGDYVYIDGNIDSYNGFKYVDSISYDSFKIKNSEDGDLVEYVQDADISYRTSVLNHGWQAVHLPIVYELQSDLWPNNTAEEAYTPNTVVSQENSNGNTKLNLINAITPDPVRLNFIELVGDGPLAGAYQILQVDQDWAIVINLAYDASNDFSVYQVVNYYNNYAINVDVYAGLPADHRWASKKPYELATTLKFTPDADGKIKFSIADILKGYITTRNNLTLDTLPNNLDFHVALYIAYYESYDQSDGTTIETFEGGVTTDTFEGHAVNSMMPFKSLNSGHMSDYVNQDTFLARWLTLFDVPTAVVGLYFDLSFLLQYSGFDVVVTIYKSLNDLVTGTETITISNPGFGVIRVGFTPETGFDKYCVQAKSAGSFFLSLSSFLNSGSGTSWTLGVNPSVSFSGPSSTKILYKLFSFIAGADYTITVIYTGTANSLDDVRLSVYDALFNQLFTTTDVIANGSNTFSLTFTATEDSAIIGLTTGGSGVPAETITITSIEMAVAEQNITEQICINIVDECEGTFTSDDLRLTEGADLRELE